MVIARPVASAAAGAEGRVDGDAEPARAPVERDPECDEGLAGRA